MADFGEVAMAYERCNMLNIGTQNATGAYDASGNNFVLMGSGFETIDESMNPIVDEAKYVNMSNSSKSIIGYAPEIKFDGDVIKDNSVIAFLRNIAINRLVGNDAESEVISFDVWDVSVSDTVAATKQRVAVQIDNPHTVKGLEKLKLSGALLAKGDPIQGTYNVDSDVFTATV